MSVRRWYLLHGLCLFGSINSGITEYREGKFGRCNLRHRLASHTIFHVDPSTLEGSMHIRRWKNTTFFEMGRFSILHRYILIFKNEFLCTISVEAVESILYVLIICKIGRWGEQFAKAHIVPTYLWHIFFSCFIFRFFSCRYKNFYDRMHLLLHVVSIR